ncbi:hypothetical protein [Actinomyces sp.]
MSMLNNQQGGQPAAQPYVPAGQPVQPAPRGYSAVPQGIAPGYSPVPQGPVVQKVNWPSNILGIIGWTLIGLTLLAMWMALRASASDPDPSGKDIIGFFPLFALFIIGPVNLAGGIAGIVGAVGKPKTLKLNWLGILLNASPYVIFTVLPFLLAILFGR